MIEPTKAQRAQLHDIGAGEAALVQFLAPKEQGAFKQYRTVSAGAVAEAGGRRTHDVVIDQTLAGGKMPYQAITVDVFSSSDSLLTGFEAIQGERQAAVAEIYGLIVRPAARLPRVVKRLGFLAPLLSRILGTTREKEMVNLERTVNPNTGPVPETIAEMRKYEQTTPFYMMNLNRYYGKAQTNDGGDISGEEAYNRYSRRIVPYLISVGGYPDMFGNVLSLFVGDENSPLYDEWSDFAMVYYPSRRNFLRMMSHAPSKGVFHRDAGLQRAILMPSSDADGGLGRSARP